MSTHVWVIEYKFGDGEWQPSESLHYRNHKDAVQMCSHMIATYPANLEYRVEKYVREEER